MVHLRTTVPLLIALAVASPAQAAVSCGFAGGTATVSDTLRASAGGDLLDGGTGSDTADYSPRPPGVVVNLTAGTGSSSGDTDLITALRT